MTHEDDKDPNSTEAMSESDGATGAGSESPEEGAAAMSDAEDAVEN